MNETLTPMGNMLTITRIIAIITIKSNLLSFTIIYRDRSMGGDIVTEIDRRTERSADRSADRKICGD